jgi:hypothetical protein
MRWVFASRRRSSSPYSAQFLAELVDARDFVRGKLILKPTESYARIRVRKPGACRTLLFIKKWNQSLDVGEPEIDGEEPVGIQLQLLHLSLLSQNFLLFSLLHQLLNAC